jgi:hypothetical protein
MKDLSGDDDAIGDFPLETRLSGGTKNANETTFACRRHCRALALDP